MIVVMNRIPVNPEFSEKFEERFSDRAALVDGMEGFVSFRLLRPTQADDPYIVMTFWETHEHFVAWTESPEFKEGHARAGRLPSGAFKGHPQLEVMEIALEAVKGKILPENV
jgi:heme-degrading monooxygenase HmoA